ncbi:MAG: chitobiase/beta-hexosaminidase C-terminal domain-containing protein [Lachnospiraceae bacterium]|nr:chitobiase/beta-hexosaminidase C-terminal domain-containing protein [Lachnospiraceae bacterium]
MKKTNLISLIILILALGAAVAGLSLAAGGGSAAGRAEMSAEDHLARAKLYVDQEAYGKAVVSFRKSLDLGGEAETCLRGLAECYEKMDYHDDAADAYREMEDKGLAGEEDILEHASILLSEKKLEDAKELIAKHQDAKDPEFGRLYDQMSTEAPRFKRQGGTIQEYCILYAEELPEGYSLYYTVNGKEPDRNALLYTEKGIVLSYPDTVIRAKTYSSLGYESEVAELHFTVDVPVEEVDPQKKISLVRRIASNALKKNYDDIVYNYELAQLRKLYIIGDYIVNTEPGSYVFHKGAYAYNSNDSDNTYRGKVDLSVLRYMPYLQTLAVCNCEIGDLTPVSELKELRELSLLNDGLEDISALSNLTGLRKLALGWNELTDVSSLSRLTELESLGLWNNRLEDLSPLRGMSKLSCLDVAGNNVRDISVVREMPLLFELWINGNPITDRSVVDEHPMIQLIR